MKPIIITDWIDRMAHDLVAPCNMGGTSYDRIYRLVSNIRSGIINENKER